FRGAAPRRRPRGSPCSARRGPRAPRPRPDAGGDAPRRARRARRTADRGARSSTSGGRSPTASPRQQHVGALFAHQKLAPARSLITAIGRSALTTASILLMKEFLGGIIGDTGGLAGAVSATLGPQGALAVLAVLLVGTYVGASVMAYDNEVMQQRLVKVLEL